MTLTITVPMIGPEMCTGPEDGHDQAGDGNAQAENLIGNNIGVVWL